MWAIVHLGNKSSRLCEFVLNAEMDFQEIFHPYSIRGNTSLVRNHKNFIPRPIQCGYSLHSAGDESYFAPGFYVFSRWCFLVDNPIPVKKHSSSKRTHVRQSRHARDCLQLVDFGRSLNTTGPSQIRQFYS